MTDTNTPERDIEFEKFEARLELEKLMEKGAWEALDKEEIKRMMELMEIITE